MTYWTLAGIAVFLGLSALCGVLVLCAVLERLGRLEQMLNEAFMSDRRAPAPKSSVHYKGKPND